MVSWILFFGKFFWIIWLFYCVYLSWEFRFMHYLSAIHYQSILLRHTSFRGCSGRLPLMSSSYILVYVCTSLDVLNCQFVQSWITLMMDYSWNAFPPTVKKKTINDIFGCFDLQNMPSVKSVPSSGKVQSQQPHHYLYNLKLNYLITTVTTQKPHQLSPIVFSTNLSPRCSLFIFLHLLILMNVLLQPWGWRLLIFCCRVYSVLLPTHLSFGLVFTVKRGRGRLERTWWRCARPRLNFSEDWPLLGCTLLEYSAQFIDKDKGFGTVGLSTSQTASQGVPKLHRRQIVRGGLGMLILEIGQDLWAVLGKSWAVLHKLGGWRKQKGWGDNVNKTLTRHLG